MSDCLTSAAAGLPGRLSRPRAWPRGTRAAVWIALFTLLSPGHLAAQRRPQRAPGWSDAGEFYWGIAVNVRYGRTSGIGLYPLVGYKITAQWSVGARIGYEFWWRDRFAETLTTHAVSGSLFTRYRLIPQVYAHVEGGAGNYDRIIYTGESDRVTYPFLFVGGGLSQPTGRRSALMFEVLYEVIQDTYSPYAGGGLVISIGFGVGF